jgi:hypothetical protein
MKSRVKPILAAAAASVALVGVVTPASAGLVLSFDVTKSVTYPNGTYDVVDVVVTSFTGADTTSGVGDTSADVLDPEILTFNGAFTATGTAVLGTPGSTTGAHAASKYDNYSGSPQAQAVINGNAVGRASSFVGLPNSNGPYLQVGNTGASTASSTSITGNSTAFSDTWSVTPTTSASGPAGGIEPGVDNSGYGVNGLIAEILVTPGGGFSFTGTYSTYANGGVAEAETFTYPATTSPTSTHSIISLTSTAPTGYGNSLTTIALTHGPGGAVVPGYDFLSSTTTATAVQPVTGFVATDVPQEFALALLVGGATPTSAQLAQIISDINSASSTDGVVASLVPANFAGVFKASQGFDVMLTSTTSDTTPNLGFDFSAETTVASVTVSAVAAVPEPATAVGLLVGAGSLLLGRRKNRAA